jgi:type IV pilus assembly protein PilE
MPTRAQGAAGLRQHRTRGVTLIELLVVLAIVAILSSLAVASYRRYVLRANRTDATSALLRIQVGEEKYFLQNNTYTINATATPPTGLGVASPTPNGFYNITVTAGSTGSIATSFSATAAATSTQTQDTSCLTLTIDDQGLRNSAPSTTDCWR